MWNGPAELGDRVHRYNKESLDGLVDRARSGRPASLSWVEQGKLSSWVEEGADLARAGVVRFRRVDFAPIRRTGQPVFLKPAATPFIAMRMARLVFSSCCPRRHRRISSI